MRGSIRATFAALALCATALFAAPAANAEAPAAAACDLHVADAVGYSALMLYVGVSLDGCDNSVTEAWVELKRSDSPGGPFVTVDTAGVYSGGAAWFDEPNYGCAYYIATAHWENQTETTPRVTQHCL